MAKDIISVKSERYARAYGDTISFCQEHFKKAYGKYKTWGETEDVYAIGQYCENVTNLLDFMVEAASTDAGNLGDVLKSSMGLVAASYATSIIPFIGSTQPAEQEIAIIYFKTAIASADRGSVKKGDMLQNPYGRINAGFDEYTAFDQIKSGKLSEAIGAIVGKTVSGKLGNGNIRPNTVQININGKRLIDNGSGNLYGSNVDSDKSTIDYTTGDIKIEFITAPTDEATEVVFTEMTVAQTSVPGWSYNLISKPVSINYWPLQASFDVLADFLAKRRFGTSLETMANQDLLNQLNRITSYNAIKQLRIAAIRNEAEVINGNALGGVEWSTVAPAGVSLIEHRRTFFDIYEQALRRMELITGIGGVSAIITGSAGRQIFRSLGIDAKASTQPGCYVIGFQDGIPVIYAPNDLLPADEVLLVYKGSDMFTTPLVYAPFLPVMKMTVNGRTDNVFQRTSGVVHGAGLKVVNPGLVQRIKLTNTGLTNADLSGVMPKGY